MRPTLTSLTGLTLLTLLGCEPPPTASIQTPIVDGTRELGEPAVVTVQTFGGVGLCTGTLITPNVVLTAKHCVQGAGAERPYPVSAFTIGVGDRVGATENHRVRYVETTPGVYESDRTQGLRGAIFGIDVAVLVLREPITDIEPIPVRRDRPDDMIGQTFTAIGFGDRPDGNAGLKYKGDGVLASISESILYTREVICSGDSGGPMIQEAPERRVIGVASFGQADSCPSFQDGYNALYEHIDLIDRARVIAGECLDSEEECNSLDDDCDGEIDEGCVAFGESCTADTDCAFAQLPGFLAPLENPVRCEDAGAGSICTRACDPLVPVAGCDSIEHFGGAGATRVDGLYCRRTNGCDGRCAIGAAGAGADGDECAADTECASLSCTDPGDGRARCLPPCRGGAGTCPLGEACAAGPGACGSCVDAGALAATRQLGEPCERDDQCAEGAVCLADPSGAYCASRCVRDDECADGYHCQDERCTRGARASVGEPCEGNDDCVRGAFCADQGGRRWCTRFCDDTMTCPDGLACVAAGGASVCAPSGSLLGETCASDAECPGGVCEGVCTRACGECPIGFVCRRDGEGRARCLAPAPAGGCSVAPGSSSSTFFAILIAPLALLMRRRRRST